MRPSDFLEKFSQSLDLRTRIEGFYKVVDKDGNLVPLLLSALTERILSLPNRSYILKPKQAWVTTIVLVLIIEYMRLRPNFIAYSVAHNLEIQKTLKRKFEQLVNSLPPDLRPVIIKNREDLIEFANGSIYTIVTIGGKPPAQGTSINFLHLTELWAFDIDVPTADIEVYYNFLRAGVTEDGIIMAETTPGPAGSFAHGLFTKAKGKGTMKALFVEWYWHPEYSLPRAKWGDVMDEPISEREQYLVRRGVTQEQIAWSRKEIRDTLFGLQGFLMTYPEDDDTCWFQTSGSYFNAALINSWLRERDFPEPIGTWIH